MAERPLTPPTPGTACAEAAQDDEWLTVPEVMARLRLGRSTVYDLIRSKALASTHVGRCRRVPLSALRAFMAHQLEEAV